MADTRKHRGPHPEDRKLFAGSQVPLLRQAVHDLSWLLSRGYASPSSVKLVGDRYSLNTRQRLSVARSSCSDDAVARRSRHRVSTDQISGESLWLDGYNVLTTIEAALAGGVILFTRDGCYRDMASMHGSYRKVEETIPAIRLLGELLHDWRVDTCHWFLDQPVSNSGRLKKILATVAEENSWKWEIELVPDPDRILKECQEIVVSADSQILDSTGRWFNLAAEAVRLRISTAWLINLASSSNTDEQSKYAD